MTLTLKYNGTLPSSIFGKKMIILEEHEDDMECMVRCLNCGQPTKYGKTRMISGYVGCDNKIEGIGSCYFDDLMPRVMKFKEEEYEGYVTGEGVYRYKEMNE